MKTIKILLLLATVSVALVSCSLFGLDVQEDYYYKQRVLDPHINMTVSEFLYSDVGHQLDSVISAINYAGLQDEYAVAGRTHFLLHNLAIYRTNTAGVVDANCYFGKFKVNGLPAKKWKDYPVQQVKDLLLYHIVEGQYSFDNLTPDNLEVTTLLATDKGRMFLKVINDRDSKVRVNEFFGSLKTVSVRTSNILATDGTIHILGDYAEYIPG